MDRRRPRAFGMIATGRTLSKVMVTASCLTWRLPVTVQGIGPGGRRHRRVDRRRLGSCRRSSTASASKPGWPSPGCRSLPLRHLRRGLGGAVAVAAPGDDRPRRTAAGRRAGPRHDRRHAGRSASCTCRTSSARRRELYGAIGTTIVTLGWFFFLGRAMVLGDVRSTP